jgi:hypothetical protein
MPEALTESFCERCGTKYEFAAPTHLNTLRKTRGVLSGLRNYIMSQDALSDAMGDALRSEEEQLAAQQLEAFHESFNFCIDCRQYTCTNCWNDPAGRCRSCVPVAGTDDLLERFEATFQAQHPELISPQMDQGDLERRLGTEAWPTADLATGNGHPALAWPDVELARAAPQAELEAEGEAFLAEVVEPEPATEPEVAGEPEAEAEPEAAESEVAAEPEIGAEAQPEEWAEPEPEPVEVAALVPYEEPELQPAATAEPPEPEPALTIVWDADAPFELEPIPVAPEPEPIEVAAEVEPEPIEVAAEVEPPVAVETEPEPVEIAAEVAAEPEPEPPPSVEPEPPQPAAPAPRPIRPISETLLRIPRPTPAEPAPAQVAAQDETPELAARRAKLDLLGLGDPGEGPVAEAGKVLPYRSRGAAVHPTELARRGAASLQAVPGFWEASAREVAGAMTNVGVQSCGQCGLSLSATARFCRRCGTRQAQPA